MEFNTSQHLIYFLYYCLYFLLLMLYSFLGWCGEMVYCSIGQRRLCEKRGFLNGPLCPIYGHGALLVLCVLHGGCASPIWTFALGAVLTSAVEYVTSFAMERLFHMRWWDYSKMKFNINGRVCLLNSLLFGLACVLLCHVIHPAVEWRVAYLVLRTKAGIPLAMALSLVYFADIFFSVRSAIRLGDRLEKLHSLLDEFSEKLEQVKAEQQKAAEMQRARVEEQLETQKERLESRLEAARSAPAKLSAELGERLERVKAEFQQRAGALYEKQGFFERRLMRSFPAMRSTRHGEALSRLREYWEAKRK